MPSRIRLASAWRVVVVPGEQAGAQRVHELADGLGGEQLTPGPNRRAPRPVCGSSTATPSAS